MTGFVVLDDEGRVTATSGDAAYRPAAGDEEFLLGGGDRLFVRHGDPAAWHRLARAFVHELRSPMNALLIYLDLLGARVEGLPAGERAESSPTRLVEKAAAQVRRLDELSRAFEQIWGPAEEGGADLARVARAIVRIVEHEAKRHGVEFAAQICETAPVTSADERLAAVLAPALLRLVEASAGGRVEVTVARGPGGAAVLRVATVPAAPADVLARARGALEAQGADVTLEGGTISAAFGEAGAVRGADRGHSDAEERS